MSDPTISLWVVAFLDLLGYREVLKGMDIFPIPNDTEGRSALTQSFVRAVHFRTRLLEQLKIFRESQIDASVPIAGVSEELSARIRSRRNIRIHEIPGADHVVLACSLAPSGDEVPIDSVFSLVSSAAAAMLIQLSVGGDDILDTLPIRGGIDMAAGGQDPRDSYLYSAAIRGAYDLEHKTAIFPRTVVSNKVDDFIRSAIENDEDKISRAIGLRISHMFVKDPDDKLTMLDFFGAAIRSSLPHDFAKSIATNAWTFVCGSAKHFQLAGNEKVSAKYEWLIRYMEPRLSLWGVN